jgi:hypothetical protein
MFFSVSKVKLSSAGRKCTHSERMVQWDWGAGNVLSGHYEARIIQEQRSAEVSQRSLP